MATSPESAIAEPACSFGYREARNSEAMSVKTDCPQSFPSLTGSRVVTLQYPWEHETRVDPVLSRDVQRKRSVEMGFLGKPRSRLLGLISSWPSRHKTYRRR